MAKGAGRPQMTVASHVLKGGRGQGLYVGSSKVSVKARTTRSVKSAKAKMPKAPKARRARKTRAAKTTATVGTSPAQQVTSGNGGVVYRPL